MTCSTRSLPEDASPILKITTYRILREAMHNSFKHAGGLGLKVRALASKTHLRLVVQDAGRGFSPEAADVGGLGMIGMRNRVEGLNGTFEVRSSPGRGTRIRVTISLEEGGPA